MPFTHTVSALGLGTQSEQPMGLRSLHVVHQNQGNMPVLVHSKSDLLFQERHIYTSSPFISLSWSCKFHTVSPILIVYCAFNAAVGFIGQGRQRQQSEAHYFMMLKASIWYVHNKITGGHMIKLQGARGP